jgi:hypothetical protein
MNVRSCFCILLYHNPLTSSRAMLTSPHLIPGCADIPSPHPGLCSQLPAAQLLHQGRCSSVFCCGPTNMKGHDMNFRDQPAWQLLYCTKRFCPWLCALKGKSDHVCYIFWSIFILSEKMPNNFEEFAFLLLWSHQNKLCLDAPEKYNSAVPCWTKLAFNCTKPPLFEEVCM